MYSIFKVHEWDLNAAVATQTAPDITPQVEAEAPMSTSSSKDLSQEILFNISAPLTLRPLHKSKNSLLFLGNFDRFATPEHLFRKG